MKRTCYKCKVDKPLTDFSKSIGRRLGREYICRLCKRGSFKNWWHGDKGKNYRESNSSRLREAEKKSVAKYPEKDKARRLLRMAVNLGVVKKIPCRDCGSPKVQGHHKDYSKPLEVVWLCTADHKQEHLN